MKNCKECLYHKMCPFNISGTEAEQCKTYEPKEDYVKVVRCKDCAHHGHVSKWCKVQARVTENNEYCSLAKKRGK